jgi:hypothetical protein
MMAKWISSASMIHRIAQCPGSQELVETLRAKGEPVKKTDPAAEKGIRIHQYLKEHPQPVTTLDDDELKIAFACIELREKIVTDWFDQSAGAAIAIREQRFYYRRYLRPLFTGQIDYALIQGKRALIVDYKTGRREAVEAADNMQLRVLSVLLAHEFDDLEQIDACIIEPLVSRSPVRVRYQQDDIAVAAAEIAEIVERARRESNLRIAGPWCEYCPAKTHCPECRATLDTIHAGHTVLITTGDLPRGDEGTALWEKIKIAKKLIEALEEAYLRILENEPEALPGYVLPKQGRKRRFVAYPAKFKEALADYLSAEQIDGCATYHIDKIKQLFALRHPPEQFDELIAQVVQVTYDNAYIRKEMRPEREKRLTEN